MSDDTRILLGTGKGAFILESGPGRQDWHLRGPFCGLQPVNHVIEDTQTGYLFAAGGSQWEGACVWRSLDQGRTWTKHDQGLGFAADEPPVNSVWSVAAQAGRIFAGVRPAGLFVSDDLGQSWQLVRGLHDHPSRNGWGPGGAGMILHHIEPHPSDPLQFWVGISVAGVFHTSDGGASFEPRNQGTRQDYAPEEHRYPEFGQCVHSVAVSPTMPDRLYQQGHCGMYRSDDGGRRWQSIEAGLPSSFGFPTAVHPRDPDTVFLIPLNGDSDGRFMPDAKAAVWRSRDAGRTWCDLRHGLPQEHAYQCVLRQALATDGCDPVGVYFGASGGTLYGSIDEGDRWQVLAEHLPSINSVETAQNMASHAAA